MSTNGSPSYLESTSIEEILLLERELLKKAIEGNNTEQLEQVFQKKALEAGIAKFATGGEV